MYFPCIINFVVPLTIIFRVPNHKARSRCNENEHNLQCFEMFQFNFQSFIHLM